jgi:hypothetical protein
MSDGGWRLVLAVGLVLAVWRITRLLVVDEFPPVRAVREWFIRTFAIISVEGEMTGGRRLGGIGHAIAYIWTCPWCMSVYVGASVWAAADWRLSVPFPWLIVALGSGLSGVWGMVESEHDQRYKLRDAEIERGVRR